ncbi:hypothetical protein CPJCM30710_19430 [Clostridium polyendosporum]|uniref:Peptidase MA superfamily protein n=1 Tax=Clostridium polyendosporum TaxID=69208 RepID=A0A919RZE9_9CLOT|nr:hypothetical protein [Clostridium polyendosporum]GIM29277.1 hypothetical protein CPJCM30710_19430 [Clostridium polyendosporum]
MNKKFKALLMTISCILILSVIQTIPAFILKPIGAKELKGKNVIIYYQTKDEKGAKEVYQVLENTVGEIREKLEFNSIKPTKVYLYGNQKSLWIRKYGLITTLGAPEWYVDDNKGDKVLIVSPYVNIKGHNHDSILSAATHELVHTINYQINPKLSYWNDNGVANFLAKQSPPQGFTKYNSIPTIDDMKSENQKRFGDIGGYQYSYTYIEFLNNAYGWNKVLELINGKKTYTEIFSKSEHDIYNEWLEFLKVKWGVPKV